jgi:Rad3-related DNA helicase
MEEALSILDYIPKAFTPREVQIKALLDIEKAWETHSVIVVPGPVAFGKSLVGTTVALWRRAKGEGTAYLTSQVILQEQLAKTPPYFPVLKGRKWYTCSGSGGEYSCEERHAITKKYCATCPYKTARDAAMDSPIGVFNFHSYLFNQAYKDVLFIDEAHTLLGMISDFYTLKVWKHKTPYPAFNSKGDVAVWLERLIKKEEAALKQLRQVGDKKRIWESEKHIRKLEVIYRAIDLSPADFFVEQTAESYRGKDLEVLKIRPLNIRNIRTGLWPRKKVSKILMSSATILDLDLYDLGLDETRVAYLECESPIPEESRPFIFTPVANMGYKFQKKNAPKMAAHLMQLAARHSDSKGVIHMPYGMKWLFKPILRGPRWMWHDKENKMEVLQQFMRDSQNRILVAHGMDQGVDLAGPDFGWQAIVKVPWPSLADQLIKTQARERPVWYIWQTIRTIVQQYGRICRTPTDRGVTYMLDTAFRQIDPELKKHLQLWPKWFVAARKEEDASGESH